MHHAFTDIDAVIESNGVAQTYNQAASSHQMLFGLYKPTAVLAIKDTPLAKLKALAAAIHIENKMGIVLPVLLVTADRKTEAYTLKSQLADIFTAQKDTDSEEAKKVVEIASSLGCPSDKVAEQLEWRANPESFTSVSIAEEVYKLCAYQGVSRGGTDSGAAGAASAAAVAVSPNVKILEHFDPVLELAVAQKNHLLIYQFLCAFTEKFLDQAPRLKLFNHPEYKELVVFLLWLAAKESNTFLVKLILNVKPEMIAYVFPNNRSLKEILKEASPMADLRFIDDHASREGFGATLMRLNWQDFNPDFIDHQFYLQFLFDAFQVGDTKKVDWFRQRLTDPGSQQATLQSVANMLYQPKVMNQLATWIDVGMPVQQWVFDNRQFEIKRVEDPFLKSLIGWKNRAPKIHEPIHFLKITPSEIALFFKLAFALLRNNRLTAVVSNGEVLKQFHDYYFRCLCQFLDANIALGGMNKVTRIAWLQWAKAQAIFSEHCSGVPIGKPTSLIDIENRFEKEGVSPSSAGALFSAALLGGNFDTVTAYKSLLEAINAVLASRLTAYWRPKNPMASLRILGQLIATDVQIDGHDADCFARLQGLRLELAEVLRVMDIDHIPRVTSVDEYAAVEGTLAATLARAKAVFTEIQSADDWPKVSPEMRALLTEVAVQYDLTESPASAAVSAASAASYSPDSGAGSLAEPG